MVISSIKMKSRCHGITSNIEGGDSERGRQVFDGPGGCQRCHAIGSDAGRRAGPDLKGVGKRRDREFLLESVLLPEAEIAPGFGTVGLVLRDGEVVSGSVVAESDAALTIEREGERRRIERADIASASPPASGMPPMGLVLPLADLRDLVEFLASL